MIRLNSFQEYKADLMSEGKSILFTSYVEKILNLPQKSSGLCPGLLGGVDMTSLECHA